MKRYTLLCSILLILICLSSCSKSEKDHSLLPNGIAEGLQQIPRVTMIPGATPDKNKNPLPDTSQVGVSKGKMRLHELSDGTIFLYDYIGSGQYPKLITIGPDNIGQTIIMKNYTMNASDMFSVSIARTIISMRAVQVFPQEYQYLRSLMDSVPDALFYEAEKAEIADYPITYIGFVKEGKVKLSTIDTLNDGLLSVDDRLRYLIDEYKLDF